MNMVVAILVQHRYSTGTALDKNGMIYRNELEVFREDIPHAISANCYPYVPITIADLN